jgi:wyosine [tRNA(Phe)-imidazoG37] synthetase (radical SAM superfamily)
MESKSTPRHVYGPVPSRRLGRSLGVDLVPPKTCTYDCIYCQLGRTIRKTCWRREWVPVEEVLEEVKSRLSTRPDYIALSGSGEPTLHARLDEIISGIKRLSPVPVAVLTNGSLLNDPSVRDALAEADLVIPSLDAGESVLFRCVNRPCDGITLEGLVEGLETFRRGYGGLVWLEVFLLGGITAIPAEVEKIARLARRIHPHRVQLNAIVRPPAERFAGPVPREQLERLAALFDGNAEVIADPSPAPPEGRDTARPGDILDLLGRRPCTVQDIAAGLGLHPQEAAKSVELLTRRHLVSVDRAGGRIFFRAKRADAACPASSCAKRGGRT